MVRNDSIRIGTLGPVSLLALLACGRTDHPQPGHVLDEARLAGRAAASLPAADEDYFREMDGGVALTPEEIKGRNTWMIWTAGNADFWNWLAQYGYGTNDLLKTLDSRHRHERFRTMGLMNEPGFRQTGTPDSATGLYLDERVTPPEDVDTLIAKEYLAEGDRADLKAIHQASIAFVSDAFCHAR